VDLVKLSNVIKGHHGNAVLLSVGQVVRVFAWVREDDGRGLATHVEDLLDLTLARAVESGAEMEKSLGDLGVGIRLNSVERFSARELLLPQQVFIHNGGKVDKVERTAFLLDQLHDVVGDGARNGVEINDWSVLGSILVELGPDIMLQLANKHRVVQISDFS